MIYFNSFKCILVSSLLFVVTTMNMHAYKKSKVSARIAKFIKTQKPDEERVLDFSDCELTSSNLLEVLFLIDANVRRSIINLDLHNNDLKVLPEGLAKLLPNISSLNLAWNRLDLFRNRIALNSLLNIPPSVRVLDLSGNDLFVLPEGFAQLLPNLCSLNLSHNRLEPHTLLNISPSVQILILCTIDITELPAQFAQQYPKLQKIILMENDLNYETLRNIPPSIQILDLARCNLKELPNGTFGGLMKGESLNDDNKEGLINLKELNLSCNYALRSLGFKGLLSCEKINLNDAPDEVQKKLDAWMTEKKLKQPLQIEEQAQRLEFFQLFTKLRRQQNSAQQKGEPTTKELQQGANTLQDCVNLFLWTIEKNDQQ